MKTKKQLEAEIKNMENAVGWSFGTIIILLRDIHKWDNRLMNEPGPDTIIQVTNEMERYLSDLDEFTDEKKPSLEKIIAQSKKPVKR